MVDNTKLRQRRSKSSAISLCSNLSWCSKRRIKPMGHIVARTMIPGGLAGTRPFPHTPAWNRDGQAISALLKGSPQTLCWKKTGKALDTLGTATPASSVYEDTQFPKRTRRTSRSVTYRFSPTNNIHWLTTIYEVTFIRVCDVLNKIIINFSKSERNSIVQ